MNSKSNITVAGAGFAAITGVRELRKRLPAADITLVAPKPEFIYLPSLIWVPYGMRNGDDLRFDIRPLLKKLDVSYVQSAVTGISADGRTLQTGAGDVSNDALLIATGGRYIRKLPGIENVITICEGIEAAEKMGERLKAMNGGTIAMGFGGNPKEPSAMRGGPMFELLFGLETWLKQQGQRDRFRLVFFTPAPQPGKRLGEKAVVKLLEEMKRRGIETHLGHKLRSFENHTVTTEGGEIPADLILFMPGMTGPSWMQGTPLPVSNGGMIQADAFCQVTGMERVYVAGDAGSFPGPEWMPKQAHMADLQAKAAAQNMALNLAGKAAEKQFKVELLCIIDSLDKGMLVYRGERGGMALPAMKPLHWAKKYFEKTYLRHFRL
ncbi:MAG: FAD-dependent oxidoreductase [Xanthomonadales bacterium]|jgi:sulfide:quinone oxidoreductase|nr:FAD-dependent oxidoreductase [Xanthomonadales bacterium]MDH3924154.1 FAD-dependent oxidoreductase [Xanthomonadales bacterium]MDH3940294.1 FAD-dependent oxidoreductase [Xanthomonadales bacterium]MDH4002786.1 FAD-dependent oxidoreductase [Xanthomonadales bacterium]